MQMSMRIWVRTLCEHRRPLAGLQRTTQLSVAELLVLVAEPVMRACVDFTLPARGETLLLQEGAMRLAPRAANQHAYKANDRIVVIANSGS